MATERTRVSDLATWVGGQLKAVRTYAAGQATAAADAVLTQAKAYADQKAEATYQRIVGPASSAYDTLAELQAAVQADDSAIAGILTALGKRVRVDASQTFTADETAQARANIAAAGLAVDLGAVDVDYVALATTALNS